MNYREKIIHFRDGLPIAVYNLSETHERYRMVLHWHPEHEIVYVKSGAFHMRLNDTVFTATAGDVIFVPGGTIHAGEPEQCVYTCILTDLEKLLAKSDDCVGFARMLSAGEIEINTRLSAGNGQFAAICDAISLLRETDRVGYSFALKGKLFAIFAEVIAGACYSRKPSERCEASLRREKMKLAITYMEDNCGERISLEMLARMTDMSVNHFLRSFKELTGTSPLKYLNEYRLAKACYALREGSQSVTAVALTCGFGDASYFIQCFKRAFGVTPKEFAGV